MTNKKKGFNPWPWGIGLSFLAFMLFIGFNFYNFSQKETHLVVNDYYKAEKRFQQHIDQIQNHKSLSKQVNIGFTDDRKQIQFQFPPMFEPSKTQGNIELYRPSDADQDFNTSVDLDTSNQQTIPVKQFDKGQWRIKLSWSSLGTKYYKEESIVLR